MIKSQNQNRNKIIYNILKDLQKMGYKELEQSNISYTEGKELFVKGSVYNEKSRQIGAFKEKGVIRGIGDEGTHWSMICRLMKGLEDLCELIKEAN